mmetsp:Transcript_4255/g.11895  ORF Transcript_4255/g.11895 Transcript_4255/m.11895 type:complete len:479 (+) Transcript_4255:50-1486(+)|eukprot:CAMPEP_0119129498 /NCGR_PEP_ID=MMETSP1310-20130426/7216_1 /TAXON_ID=464262 /ORGANISM="Genus nov. species nov., Strain RCC2339" /LENGTH=478 /DNA_ID=CAMNT_0007119919 /DNA_START=36 /DNA_END=1472 /DNA_ORIENTATION=+
MTNSDHASHESDEGDEGDWEWGEGMKPALGTRRELYNVIHLGVACLFLFTSFNTTQSLQSSVNAKVGLVSLGVLYLSFSLSSILVANTLASKLGTRWSLVLGSACYVFFIGANVKVIPPVLIVTSALTGFGASILWTAQGAYLADNSDASNSGLHSGVFWAIFQVQGIVGNMAAQFLLNLETSRAELYLFGGFSALAVAAVVLLCFLRSPPPRTGERCKIVNAMETGEGKVGADPAGEGGVPGGLALVREVFVLFVNPCMLHLEPLFVYVGVSVAVYFGAITARLSTTWLGYVMMAFAVCDTLSSIVAGRLSDAVGRLPVVLAGAVVSVLGLLVAYFAGVCEDPEEGTDDGVSVGEADCGTTQVALFFVAAVLNGLADGVFNTQTYAMVSDHFGAQATPAFALSVFLRSSSSGVMFFLSLVVPYGGQAIIMIFFLVLGVLLYSRLRWMARKSTSLYFEEASSTLSDDPGTSSPGSCDE